MRKDLDRKTIYNIEYAKKNLKRVPFNVTKEYFENVLKPAADAAGENVSEFLKNSIEQRISRDGLLAARDDDPEEIPPAL